MFLIELVSAWNVRQREDMPTEISQNLSQKFFFFKNQNVLLIMEMNGVLITYYLRKSLIKSAKLSPIPVLLVWEMAVFSVANEYLKVLFVVKKQKRDKSCL